MHNKLLLSLCVLVMASLTFGCSSSPTTTNTANAANANTANTASAANANAGTDANANAGDASTASNEYESETTDNGGTKKETRTYKNNKRISKVEITTRNGKRTARVYSRSGEARDIPEDRVDAVINSTGDAIADAAGFVADKTKDAAATAKEGAQKAGEGAQTVVNKSAEGAKTVANKTAEGAKKATKAVKNAVVP